MSSPFEIIKIWNGGLAIHGGIIAGLITIIIYCKKYKVNCLKILDIIVPGLILAQAIGRWGNFINKEAHGAITTFEYLKSLHLPNFIINNENHESYLVSILKNEFGLKIKREYLILKEEIDSNLLSSLNEEEKSILEIDPRDFLNEEENLELERLMEEHEKLEKNKQLFTM